MILKVLPGASWAWMALLRSGWSGFSRMAGPVGVGEADGELVGVEGGAGGHGEDLAGVRVHGDDGAGFAFEGLLGGELEVEVDGELEVLAGGGELLAAVADLLAVGVDDDLAVTVLAAEECVVGLLDAGAADDVAGIVGGVAGVIFEHLLGDLADVADEVGGEAVAGVEAALLVEGFELGELVFVGLDEGLLVRGDVLFEWDGLVLGRALEVAEGGLDLVEGEVEAGGDERDVGPVFGHLLAEDVAGGGRVVVDDEAAFTVEDAAARGEDGNLADAVLFGGSAVVLRAEDLQVPEAGDEDGEDENDDVLGRVQLDGGELFFAVVKVEEGRHGWWLEFRRMRMDLVEVTR